MKQYFYCLLVLLLSSCSVYHKVFHPYRLPTPKPSPEFKAQQKAKKSKRSFLSFTHGKKTNAKNEDGTDVEEAATDVSTPTGGTVPGPTASASTETRTLPEHSTVRYDKNGLMKKPKLMRRRIHKPARKPFRPLQSIRNFFKFKLHDKPNYSPDHRPAVPAPAEDPAPNVAPAPAAAPAPAPAVAPATAPGAAPVVKP
ncbi:hypothetical protein [Hymenobacter sedentarius]|uniref:hypothetical protein n=1 Tax=Hymenobacter sedentarius TaxID=1411621 RepID=UPI000A9AD116|nr:hypothetical protein [Hymenobacter sedentarius]